MNTLSHTPGPWKLATYSDKNIRDGVGVFAGLLRIVESAWGRNLEESDANARLIAAAPDMLAALRLAADFLHSLPYEASKSPSTIAQDAVNDAIAKAVRS